MSIENAKPARVNDDAKSKSEVPTKSLWSRIKHRLANMAFI